MMACSPDAGSVPSVTSGGTGAGASGGSPAGGNASGGGSPTGGSVGEDGGATGSGRPSVGCGETWAPADVELEERRRSPDILVARRERMVVGEIREYLLAVPVDYDSERPYPLVFGFHGGSGDREQLRRYMNLGSARRTQCDPECGCHWVDQLGEPEDECVQNAQIPYETSVDVETSERDEQEPILRAYVGCDPKYPVVFADHWRREQDPSEPEGERWHNPPFWSEHLIWEFFMRPPRRTRTEWSRPAASPGRGFLLNWRSSFGPFSGDGLLFSFDRVLVVGGMVALKIQEARKWGASKKGNSSQSRKKTAARPSKKRKGRR